MEYNFGAIEKKWAKKWETAKVFVAKEEPKKKKFYCLDMFPYPSGEGLHIGHAFVFSLGDIFARFKRMQGFNVLYPIGYDSLGLPAENAAIKKRVAPSIYTEKSVVNFMKQQKAMGWSYDWSRWFKTSDPDFYRWDQWIFLKMFEKGLAYRKKSSVNWCSKCKTVLANEQVINGKCWRHEDNKVEIKHLEQWYFKITNYVEELLSGLDKLDWPENAKKLQRNWIGKSHGTEILFEINNEKWSIFTTRPDTIYGVTFMVVSAQHPKLFDLVTEKQKSEVEIFLKKIKSVSQKPSALANSSKESQMSEKELEDLEKEGVFTGSYAINPLTKEQVPIYAGNFVLADYGSGMVMAVPAHDQRDFEFAKKYKLAIKQVVRKEDAPVKSYLMGASKINDNDLIKLGIKIVEKMSDGDRKIIIPKNKLKEYEKLIINKLDNGFWNEYLADEIVFLFKYKGGKTEIFILNEQTEEKIDKLAAEFVGEKWNKSCVWKWLAENNFYTDLIVHSGEGHLINSDKFNGLKNNVAKEKITEHLVKLKLGKKVVQYKLRDWLISRQRYWGTPIPIVYCDKCGIVSLSEKDLPVKLPVNVKFGKGNPLETAKQWINTKCPRCNGKAKRETDTMDTFVNSSWYFLRYTDPKNKNKIFDSKKTDYWCPVDQYIGGPEHITMHLIYVRFYTKFLRDLGLLNFDEPALRYFTQGIVHGADGEKMSKSRGNIVEPFDMIKKYGADTLRLALVSLASPDKDTNWDEKIVVGSHKFLNSVYDYFSLLKFGKSGTRVESNLNKTIKEVTEDIERFKHNLAIIKIRQLFQSFQDKRIDKETAKDFLKLLHVYCPYLTEELWSKLGNSGFISKAEWPKLDEKKIDSKFEKQDQAMDKIVSDILNIVKIIETRGEKKNKVFVYVFTHEKEFYDETEISKRVGKEIRVFAVNDKDKYDPTNKSKNTKPGKPGIYLE